MDKIRAFLKRPTNAAAIRIRRRQKVTSLIHRRLPSLKSVKFTRLPKSDHLSLYPRLVLFVIGYSWMLSTPIPFLGNRTYIDENALQPGQVCYAHQRVQLSKIII